MTSHMKTYTNGYLFERLKIICLLFVMHSKSIGMPFKLLGLSSQTKYSSIQTTSGIRSKKVFIC